MVNTSVSSEDSCGDDEYTLFVEEVVQTEPDEVAEEESSMPKDSIENADESDEATVVVDVDGDSNNVALAETNACSPSIVCQMEEIEEPAPQEHIISSSSNSDSVTKNCTASDPSDRLVEADEEKSDEPPVVEEAVESQPLCSDTDIIVPGTNEVHEKSSEVRLNGVLPSTCDPANNKSSSPIVIECCSPLKIAEESLDNLPNNRKRSSNCSMFNGCDNGITLVSDVKKRKIPDSPVKRIYAPTNGIALNADHEYAAPNQEAPTFTPSQDESSSAKGDSAETKVVAKKNIARKHTSSPYGHSKIVKDVKDTILSEVMKHEPRLSNGFVRSERLGIKPLAKTVRHQGVNTEPLYKVNFSVDNLSDDTIRTIYQSMRSNLTRRQLEEIVLQKICETISDSNEIGELKRQIYELQQAENHRKSVCFNLEKQVHQLKGVCQTFLEKANDVKREGRPVVPTMITRSVGLQVGLDTNPVSRLTNNAAPSVTHVVKTAAAKPPVSSDVAKKGGALLTGTAMTARASTTNRSFAGDKRAGERPPPSTLEAGSTIIDLTDKDDRDDDLPNTRRLPAQPPKSGQSAVRVPPGLGTKQVIARPIYRTPQPTQPPPKPELVISKKSDDRERGVSLSWSMQSSQNCGKIARYQIYAFQQTSNPSGPDPWKLVGEVDALPLPMECTLTQFFPGHRYHFKVRAVDELHRVGPFSDQKMISL